MRNSRFCMVVAVALMAASFILPALDLIGRDALALAEAAMVCAVGGLVCETIEERLS